MMDGSNILSRERLAGYEPDRLRQGVVLLVGAGALGNNLAQSLALSGVGEIRVVDFDFIEPSNATRSPLFARETALGTKRRSKAKELALAALRTSYAEAPVVRYACKRVEPLGLGAFKDVDVVASAVDSFRVRAWLADATRLLGVPLVEGGFSGSRGQVSVYSNTTAEGPCYRCLNPDAESGGVSCSLYARNLVAAGRTPATQSIAALTGAYVAEAAIRSLHPEGSPLADKMMTFDVREGRGSVMKLTADPECPGAHRKIGALREVPVRADEPLLSLFEALGDLTDPEIVLPAEYLAEAPCARCGARVYLGKPDWAVTERPACRSCGGASGNGELAGLVVVSRVGREDQLARRSCRKLGIAPLGVVEVVDRATGDSTFVELDGAVDDLFVTKRREPKCAAMDDFTPVDTAPDAPCLDEAVEGATATVSAA